MLIVISYPEVLVNEASRINALFSQGMQLFHLRKPGFTEKEMAALLDKIDPRYYAQIAIHQHHRLTEKFAIKRLHFTEAMRKQLLENDYKAMKTNALTCSTSIHHISEYDELNQVFTYTFYGPLFESISKPGYKPKEQILNIPSKRSSLQLIGLGGITQHTISKVKERSFDGVAVLGSIWTADDEIGEFLKLQKAWTQPGLTY